MTPFVEQIHGSVDEGTGKTYGFHGYWTRDWTAVDPALGTADDLRAVVDAAHRRGIRVLMDAVINHTGPATPLTLPGPTTGSARVPTAPTRTTRPRSTARWWQTLPDILTERTRRWSSRRSCWRSGTREGRRDREVAELDAFFQRTGYPRAPRYYVIKWLTDWVRELGFDGYRVDTAKHFERVSQRRAEAEAEAALADWKRGHPEQGPGRSAVLHGGRGVRLGGRPRAEATISATAKSTSSPMATTLSSTSASSAMPTARPDSCSPRYAAALHGGPLNGVAVLNYLSSHDDGSPYDLDRKDPFGAGTRLLLAPGGAQIYYGDELARPLRVAGRRGRCESALDS